MQIESQCRSIVLSASIVRTYEIFMEFFDCSSLFRLFLLFFVVFDVLPIITLFIFLKDFDPDPHLVLLLRLLLQILVLHLEISTFLL